MLGIPFSSFYHALGIHSHIFSLGDISYIVFLMSVSALLRHWMIFELQLAHNLEWYFIVEVTTYRKILYLHTKTCNLEWEGEIWNMTYYFCSRSCVLYFSGLETTTECINFLYGLVEIAASAWSNDIVGCIKDCV